MLGLSQIKRQLGRVRPAGHIKSCRGDTIMELFSLKGYGGEGITLHLVEILGYPHSTSYEGGYDIICSLEITCGCYTAKCDQYFSATGALYRFQKELKECYEHLEGKARYALLLENDLTFEVSMKTGGKAIVEGQFQERADKGNCLSFEIETDQSCFMSVISGINRLKDKLNDEDKVNF